MRINLYEHKPLFLHFGIREPTKRWKKTKKQSEIKRKDYFSPLWLQKSEKPLKNAKPRYLSESPEKFGKEAHFGLIFALT